VTVPLIQFRQFRLSIFSHLIPFRRNTPKTPSFTISTQRRITLWIRLLAISLVYTGGLSLLVSPALLFAEEPTFEKLLTSSTAKVTAITSDSQAQDFVRETMGPFVQAVAPAEARGRRQKTQALPEVLTQKMGGLAREVAIWHFSSELETRLHDGHKRETSFSNNTTDDHFSWLQKASPHPEFHRVFALATAYFELATTREPAIDTLPHYARYARYLYQKYPIQGNRKQGLLAIAEKEGAQGVLQRLHEYWTSDASKESGSPLPSVLDQESYVARYLHQHYLPLHKAYLHVALVKLQMESERRARIIWTELRQWQTDQQRQKGLMRLCGTWQWLIHNHQNHGDHKTVMIYPPPSQYYRMDPKPAQIRIQGDTAYIRWEFPRGIIQEESLLFSENDRALSGTFVNNMGPHGNITARRIKPCHGK